jgi:diguanylate cyclase (GGDEF)-like protein/PAS domain S-box-containing protein
MSEDTKTGTNLDLFASQLMVVVGFFSLLALTGWLIEQPILASFHPDFIPMAPSSGLIFLGLVIVWFINKSYPTRPGMRVLVQTVLAGLFVIVLILTLRNLTGLGPDLENLLHPSPTLFGQIFTGRMSPLTALGFLLVIPAFFLMTLPTQGIRLRNTVGVLSLVVSIIGSINILGYLFGTPLFYGGLIIPVALTSALSLWFLSLGLMLAAGPKSFPLWYFTGTALRPRLMRIFIPLSVFVVLVQGVLSNVTSKWIPNPALREILAVLIACLIIVVVVSLIVKNLGNYMEQGEQAQRLQEAVYRIAAAVETTRSINDLYAQIHQIISSVMPAENFYITLYDEARDLLEFPYFKDAEDEPFVGGIQPGKGLTAYVLRTGRSLLCTQAVHDELEQRGEVKLLGVASAIWLGIPLIVDGTTIGAMVVQHYTDPTAYSEREQKMLEFVSTQVASAIHRKQAEEALHQSEVELRALFASMEDAVLVIDRAGVYRSIAPTNPQLLVKPPEELLNKTLFDFFPPEEAETFLNVVNQVLDSKQTSRIEYKLTIGDKPIWFGTSISMLSEDTTLWVAHDITQRKRSELVRDAIFRITQAAITSEGMDVLYKSIHAILGELIPAENFYIALYDPDTDLISFPYYIDQYDEKPPESMPVQGLTGYVIRTGRPFLATRQELERLVQLGEVEVIGTLGVDWLGAPLKIEGRTIGVMTVQSYDPEIHYHQDDMNLLEFVSTQVAQAIERKRYEEALRNLSLTDELTGLYNRRAFTILAEQQMKLTHRMKRRMLLLFGDVDKLKTINDTHGHPMGDLALKEVASVLKETFREVDIVARLGGDEFLILAPDASDESVDILVQRLQDTLEKLNRGSDRPYQLNVSMGIANYDSENPCTVDELIARADVEMYRKKKSGLAGK